MKNLVTAMTQDENGNFQAVECKLWKNWHGATSLEMTKKQLREDHKSLTFVDWVVEDLEVLALNFLSPNVSFVKKWVATENGIEFKKVYRADLK